MQYQHVPFAGGAPAITALLGGHVDSLVLTLPPVTPQIVQGKLRGLGVASAKRNSAIPERADLRRDGLSQHRDRFVGRGVRSGEDTGRGGGDRLNAEINAGLKDADARERLAKAGFDPVVKIGRREQRLLQERDRALGDDGQVGRRVELTADRPPPSLPSPELSSPAKAGDPVFRAACDWPDGALSLAPASTGCPRSRA